LGSGAMKIRVMIRSEAHINNVLDRKYVSKNYGERALGHGDDPGASQFPIVTPRRQKKHPVRPTGTRVEMGSTKENKNGEQKKDDETSLKSGHTYTHKDGTET